MKTDSYSIFIKSGNKPSRFSKWLAGQYKRDDPIGDLAQDARSDKQAPWTGDVAEWEIHLAVMNACYDAWQTFYKAVKEIYPKYRNPFEEEDEEADGLFLERYIEAIKSPNPTHVTLAIRFDVLKRDNFRCCICGRNVEEDGVKLEVDHKHPKSKGGTNDPDNLWTLCFDCNRGKKAKLLDA
jgi:hypothetical protein